MITISAVVMTSIICANVCFATGTTDKLQITEENGIRTVTIQP